MTLEERAALHERLANDCALEARSAVPDDFVIDPESDHLAEIHKTLALICQELSQLDVAKCHDK